jgi:uncharacterized membrane protein
LSQDGGNSAGGAFAALFFAIGVLILFAVGFAFFLIVPFFIFLAGIVAMIISDRKRDSGGQAEPEEQEQRHGEPA